MIRALLLALAAILLVAPGQAQPATNQALHPGEMLRGRFEQERHLEGLATALKSEGHFLLAPGKGLIWQSEKPFAVVAVITPAGLMQRVGDGEPTRRPATQLPFLSRFYDMLSRALSGDWSALDHDFAIERRATATDWTIVLTPRSADDPVAAQLASITVAGGTFVDTVEIRRPNGDWERLAFLDQSRAPAALTPEETNLFESVGR